MDARRSTALRHLEYHAWATQRILESVEPLSAEELHRDMKTSHSSVWGTLEHGFQADAVWLRRHEGVVDAKLTDVGVADFESLRKQWPELQSRWIAWAGSLNDSDWPRVIEYRFLSGAEARSPIYENVLHVVNHGAYHRGQIVTMLRQLGAPPIATDFLLYVRTMMGA
jgi:uncharacterized damage-inducible protein DinB